MNTVAIIGGGFCGTLAAVNLARLTTYPLRVIVINCQYPVARGVAYSTRRNEHLLNVVARNMSAFPDIPSHFVDWLRTRSDFADVSLAELPEQFVARRVYGDYLQSLLLWHKQPLTSASRASIEIMEEEALDVAPADRGASVILKNGTKVQADRVLLATGNLTPRDVIPLGSLENHPAYCRNPWQGWEEKLPAVGENILLVGTGLTMIDAFLTLRALGWPGKIMALSRNGLLPVPHFKGSEYTEFPPEEPWTLGLENLAALIEKHCARLRSQGMNPALTVDKLRPFTQRIWRSFSVAEKREFCQHFRTRWNVVRHRIPQAIAEQIEKAQKDGTLCILQGKLGAVKDDGARIQVTIESHNGQPPQSFVVGLVVNCTGPRDSVSEAPATLFRNLLHRGLIRPDELDMGIDVTPGFAVVAADGQTSDFLYAVGPLLKGTLWETTAVPELRAQAHQVAQELLADRHLLVPDWKVDTPADLVEYCI